MRSARTRSRDGHWLGGMLALACAIALGVTAVGAVALGAQPAQQAKQAQPAATRPRAIDLGITPLIGGTPGPLDAITDVRGVEVGHSTIIRGAAGPLVVGTGPVRTGVTIVHP
ncbi:MAG: P1 family peptidase, partial [Gemmatimonadota bacterium]|nr:P1 family peptidase [Gemmatimonadota bacterium]